MEAIKTLALVAALMLVMVTGAYADNHAVKNWTEQSYAGNHLTDSKGLALYWFTKDTPGQSSCTGPCLEKWPIFYRDSVAPATGLKAQDFGVITRADGQKQSTFRGYPLYYFFKDSKPGEAAGHGLNYVWYAIDPDNFPVAK